MPRGVTAIAIFVLIVGLAFGAFYRLQFLPKMRDGEAYRTRPHAVLDHAKFAVEIFNLEKGRYPTTQEGLNLLIAGGYLKSTPYDRWGRPLNYRYPSTRSEVPFELWSFGADGKEGGFGDNGDIGNWNDTR